MDNSEQYPNWMAKDDKPDPAWMTNNQYEQYPTKLAKDNKPRPAWWGLFY